MTVSKRRRFAVLTRDRFTCRYCGRSAPSVELHVDHVHPVSLGGSDDESNLVTACVECNLSKMDRVLPDGAPPSAKPVALEEYKLARVAHPDDCGSCGLALVAAFGAERQGVGYRASYRCDRCDHRWSTYWGGDLLLTADEAAEARYSRRALDLSRDGLAEQQCGAAIAFLDGIGIEGAL